MQSLNFKSISCNQSSNHTHFAGINKIYVVKQREGLKTKYKLICKKTNNFFKRSASLIGRTTSVISQKRDSGSVDMGWGPVICSLRQAG